MDFKDFLTNMQKYGRNELKLFDPVENILQNWIALTLFALTVNSFVQKI